MTPELTATQSRNVRMNAKMRGSGIGTGEYGKNSMKLTESSRVQILEENQHHQLESQFNNRGSELSKDNNNFKKEEVRLTSLNSDLEEKKTFNFKYSSKYSTLNASNNPYLQKVNFVNP